MAKDEGNVYCVYGPGGEIVQCNQVYGQPDYGKLLAEHYMPYGRFKSPSLISSEKFFVHTRTEELVKRPNMGVTVSKSRIKAGSKDAAIFRGIPKDATIRVIALNETLHSGKWEVEELELQIPVPGMTYTVIIERWPYATFRRDVESYG